MKWLNRISSLFLIGFSILIGFLSLKLGIGKFQKVGPGFMPFLATSVLFSLSLLVLIMETKRSAKIGEKKTFMGWENLAKPISLVIGLIGYAFLLNIFGYLITAFLLMFVMFFITQPLKWRKNIIIAAIVVILSFLVFKIWLRVQLPAGIFQIGW